MTVWLFLFRLICCFVSEALRLLKPQHSLADRLAHQSIAPPSQAQAWSRKGALGEKRLLSQVFADQVRHASFGDVLRSLGRFRPSGPLGDQAVCPVLELHSFRECDSGQLFPASFAAAQGQLHRLHSRMVAVQCHRLYPLFLARGRWCDKKRFRLVQSHYFKRLLLW